jgi:uncharacterized protein YqjF (DUF2071 family)
MGQTWEQLLFAHWRLPPEQLRPHVPPALVLDTFGGSAWLGITPFLLSGLRLAGTPPLPVLSSFPELNVRTYVVAESKPGIFFFSLDAGSRFAVVAARRTYRLPYFFARISIAVSKRGVDFRSRRVDRPAADLSGSYRAVGEPFHAAGASLEHFLTERYCLYAADRSELFRAEIHHRPWQLHAAEGELGFSGLVPGDVPLEGTPLLHCSPRQDVVVWSLEPVR